MSSAFDAKKEVAMDDVRSYTGSLVNLKDEVAIDRMYGSEVADSFDVQQEVESDEKVAELVKKMLAKTKKSNMTANATNNATKNATHNISKNLT
jgi:hypothetical protein